MGSLLDQMLLKTDAELLEKLKRPHHPYDIDVAVQNACLIRILEGQQGVDKAEVAGTFDKAPMEEQVVPEQPKKRGRPAKVEGAVNE